jgi:uncharacterized protein
LNELRSPFRDRDEFRPPAGYRLTPFRFHRMGERYFLTNEVGEYLFLQRDELERFVDRKLAPSAPAYRALKAKHFLLDDQSRVALDLLALKYRSRRERVAEFTALHMFVVTLRCDHSCHYCQVSRQTEDRQQFDMSRAHAEIALEHVFRSPAKHLKVEFQGGEPLLNFELVKFVIERAARLAADRGRRVSFVIASNLSRLDDEVLDVCRSYQVHLSTSLDGPKHLHDAQRPTKTGSSYDKVTAGIRRARQALGHGAVAALMTTTPKSLALVEAIIDEYAALGFESIFLRNVSPYGFAARSLVHRYDMRDWLSFYERGLRHILRMNAAGTRIREDFASILLQNLLSPQRSGYVDLQSPAGIGIGGIVYNYDGSVFASDEGRMLAEMGDSSLRLGHLDDSSYEDIMTSDSLLIPLQESMLESAPMCSDCAFAPACGADPSFHRATQQDWLGHKAFSAFCSKQMAVLELLVGMLEDEPEARETLLSWA